MKYGRRETEQKNDTVKPLYAIFLIQVAFVFSFLCIVVFNSKISLPPNFKNRCNQIVLELGKKTYFSHTEPIAKLINQLELKGINYLSINNFSQRREVKHVINELVMWSNIIGWLYNMYAIFTVKDLN